MIEIFLASDAGLALKGLLLIAFVDFATGSFAALRDGTFAMDALAAFVRKHLLGRVLPIATLLIAGYYAGDQGAYLLAPGLAAAAAYVAETAASILGNFNPPSATVVAETSPAAIVNPVPVD